MRYLYTLVVAVALLPSPVHAQIIDELPCASILPKTEGHVVALCNRLVTERRPGGMAHVDLIDKNDWRLLEMRSLLNSTEQAPSTLCTAPRSSASLKGAELSQVLAALAALPTAERPNRVFINRAVVYGPFSVSHFEIPFELTIANSLFCGHVSFNSTRFSRSFILEKSLILAGEGDARDGAVSGIGAEISDNLKLNGIRAGLIVLARVRVGELIGAGDAKMGLFSLNEGRARRLVLRGSEASTALFKMIEPMADPEGTDRGRPAFIAAIMQYPFVYNMIDLVDAEISGEFYADRLVSDGPIAGQQARIGNLRLREAKLHAVDFRNARISDNVDLRGVTIMVPNASDNCVIDRVNKQDANFVAFSQATVGGSILFRNNRKIASGEELTSDLRASINVLLCLNDMEVRNDVDLSSLTVKGVTLSGSDIGGTVLLAEGDDHAEVEQMLDLSLLTARRLRLATGQSLPSETSLAGVALERITLLGTDEGADPARPLKKMLSRLNASTDTLASYSAIASALRNMENAAAASQVEIAREHRLTKEAGLFRRLWRWIRYMLGGYGYAPENTFFAALAATILGAAVALLSKEGRMYLGSLQYRTPFTVLTSEVVIIRQGWFLFDALVLSFDRLTPLVSINGKSKEVVFGSEGWIRVYFVAHSILGYLLAATALQFVSDAIGVGAT